MGFGNVVLGLASLAIGINHLKKGAQHLSSAGSARGVAGLGYAAGATPFANSGRKVVRAPNGADVPMRMRSYNIKSLDDRIAHLRERVDQGKRDPQIYAFARRATSARCGGSWCIEEKDNLGEARAIFRAIRKNVRYTSDIAGVDTYQRPSHTTALRAGDCDDYSTLTCSALQSIGIPCAFKVIRTKDAGDWNHIYPLAGFPRSNPKRWVPMDSSVNMPFGWEAPSKMVAASRVFRVG